MKPVSDNSRKSVSFCWPRLGEFRNYVANAWVELMLSGLGFVSGIVLARGLGPAGRGQLAAAMMWPALAALLVCLGLTHAFAYAVGAGWASPERLRRFGFRFSLGVGIPAMAVYCLLCPWIFEKQFPETIWVPMVYSLSIPLALHAGLLLPIFQGGGVYRLWNVGRVLRGGGWTLFVVLLAFSAHFTVLNLLLVQMAILLVMGVFLYVMIPRVPWTAPDAGQAPMGRIFGYGRAIYISGIAYTANQQLDQLLLSLWVGPSDLGQYAAAVTLSGVLLVVPAAIGPILFSEMARASNDPSLQGTHHRGALLATSAVLVPAGLALTFLGPWLTRLVYGSSFDSAGRLLQVLAPATVFLGLANTLSDVLRGAGKPMYSTYALVSGMVLTVLGLGWALPRFGVWGAAWVSLIAYGAMLGVHLYLLRRWQSTRVLAGSATAP